MQSNKTEQSLRKKSLRRALWQARLTPSENHIRFIPEIERDATTFLRTSARSSLQAERPMGRIGACPVYETPADWRRDVLRSDPSVAHASTEDELILLLEKNVALEILAAAHVPLSLVRLGARYPHISGKTVYVEQHDALQSDTEHLCSAE